MFDNLKSFCDLNNENEDVLFAMLSVTFNNSGKTELAHKVENLCHEQDNYCLTADECLSSRIELLQTKNQYKQQYHFLNSRGQFVFKAPSQLENAEKAYLPSWVNFKLIDEEDNILLNHNKCISKPLDIMSGFRVSLPQFPRPNVVGVRWNYMQATAKAIYELAPEIEEGLQRLNIEAHEPVFQVLIKDDGDGLGDVSQYKEKHDRFLSDKAFRYSFCILNIKVESNGVTKTIWEEKLPGSVRTNWSLVEAACDENQTAAMIVCLAPVEMEREQMKNNYLIIEMGAHIWRKFKLRFINSMVDEKRTRADGGLQGAGSKYICDVCYATEEREKSQLGSFVICRTLDETKAIADLLHFNHDKLNQTQLTALAKGVKCHPVLNIEHSEDKVDATDVKINIGKFIYKLLTREIAEVSQWAETQDKHLVENATHKLDCYLKSKIGINSSLMMPGNYARILFSEENEKHVVYLLKPGKQRDKFRELLSKIRFLHKIFSCTNPKEKYPTEWINYKKVGMEFGECLKTNYPYAHWSNYVHKVIEHVQEVIQEEGTLGGFSGEGNEAGNKIFRHLRKNHSRKSGTFESVTDVLQMHWFYCRHALMSLSHVARNKYKCTKCGQTGHNSATCPSKNKTIM